MSTWETVEKRTDGQTDRLRVPGGWLYRCQEWWREEDDLTMAVVFVPSPAKEIPG